MTALKSTKGGALRFGLRDDNQGFVEEQFKSIETLVNDFEKFVDAFITFPTVLKLNSLLVTQVNDLFNEKINIDGLDVNDSNHIKEIIF